MTTTYQFGEGEHVESSMRAILELAGDDVSGVVYRPGVGTAGAVELPDEVHAEWTKIKAEHDAEEAKQAEEAEKADAAEDEADTDEEDTDDEDDSADEGTVQAAPVTRTSRRGAAKNQE